MSFTRLFNRPLLHLLILCSAATAQAQEQWWFDVEVILFKRNATELNETFNPSASQSLNQRIPQARDLIKDVLYPDVQLIRDALPGCHASAPLPQPKAAGMSIENWIAQHRQAQFERVYRQANPFNGTAYDNQASGSDGSGDDAPQSLSSTGGRGSILAQGNSEEELPVGNTDTLFTQLRQNQRPVIKARYRAHSWLESVEIPESIGCVYPQEQQLLPEPAAQRLDIWAQVDQVPSTLNAGRVRHQQRPYVLPDSDRELGQLATRLGRQKGIQNLLHLVWRQQVAFGRENAEFLRLYAGKSLETPTHSDPSEAAASPEPQTRTSDPADVIAKVKAIIAGTAPPPTFVDADSSSKEQPTVKQVYELDGLFKVYLQYINRVPYLHIDSEMLFSRIAMVDTADAGRAAGLQSFQFQQLRRIISKQIHYFDHPLFGMVVQLRRYRPPANEPSPEDT